MMHVSRLRGYWILGGMMAAAGCSANDTAPRAHTASVHAERAPLGAMGPLIGLAGKCVDVRDGNTSNGAVIQLWDCIGGNPNQGWVLDGDAVVGLGGKCLDVPGGNAARGTPVQLYDCNGTPAQQWHVTGGALVGVGGMCLDVPGRITDNGTPLEIWDCNQGANQLFSFGANPAPASPASPMAGVFRWSSGGDPNHGPGGIDLFEQWSGQDITVAIDFEAKDTWHNATAPSWQMPAWRAWMDERPGRVLMLQVPLLPGPNDGSGPSDGGRVSLADCAAGAYDDHWRELAQNMVGYGLGAAYLRPGHEFNGDWYAWKAEGQTDNFAGCFRHFADTVHGVSRAFVVVWNPSNGDQRFGAEDAYPGDDYVDVVGVDVYDQTWAANTYPCPDGVGLQTCRDNAWASLVNGHDGLGYWAQFARDHQRPLALPEWGNAIRQDGHGGGDNPDFVQHIHDFVMDPANNVVIAAKFDVHNGDLDSQLSDNNPSDGATQMPEAAARLRSLKW